MQKSPLVMCLTNTVAANFTANCLLAIGAKPAMMEEPCEAEELARVADAILVNVGTLTSLQAEAMRKAVAVANARKIPWALDPVAVQVLAYRRGFVRELIALGPTAIRGNHDEIDSLLPLSPEIAVLSAGETDRIYFNGTTSEIAGGVPMLQQVTATGCAQGGIIAALLAMGKPPFEAVRIASLLMKQSGERAFSQAKLPGSFQIGLLDSLSLVFQNICA